MFAYNYCLTSLADVSQNVVPPTLNLHNPNVGVGLNFVPLHAQQKEVNTVISNSFGFGGTNASLVFSSYR